MLVTHYSYIVNTPPPPFNPASAGRDSIIRLARQLGPLRPL
jgi:hypothetical protein